MVVMRQVRDLRALRDLLGYHLEDLDDVLDALRERNGVRPSYRTSRRSSMLTNWIV